MDFSVKYAFFLSGGLKCDDGRVKIFLCICKNFILLLAYMDASFLGKFSVVDLKAEKNS